MTKVALLGIPWDEHSSFLRGAAAAPARIRKVLHSGCSNLCAEDGTDLAAEPRFHDAGDVDLGSEPLVAIEQRVRELRAGGSTVLALGGDHAVTFPVLRALRDEKPAILHFDAHPDLYDELDGDRLSHACPFARILEEECASRLVQVGIRTMNPHQRAQAERFGVEVIEMRAWEAVHAVAFDGPLYVSIDLDVLDPAFAPGVSHHEPGGASVRDVVAVIQALDAPVVGADIVELNPGRDTHDRTAAVACKLLKELAARILQRP